MKMPAKRDEISRFMRILRTDIQEKSLSSAGLKTRYETSRVSGLIIAKAERLDTLKTLKANITAAEDGALFTALVSMEVMVERRNHK